MEQFKQIVEISTIDLIKALNDTLRSSHRVFNEKSGREELEQVAQNKLIELINSIKV